MAARSWTFFALLSWCTSLIAGPVYEPIVGFPETPLVPQSLVLHSDGNVYGLSAGLQFYRLTPGGEFTVVGRLPAAVYRAFPTLVSGPDGKLWGTKTSNGSVFTIDVHSASVKTVAKLPWGQSPEAGQLAPNPQLVSDGNGFFWGTVAGGTAEWGTIFKIGQSSFVLTRVADFTQSIGSPNPWPLVNDGKGNLWGTGRSYNLREHISWSLYSINTRTGSITGRGFLARGVPYGPLTFDGDGSLWVAAPGGLVFKIDAEFGPVQLNVPSNELPMKLFDDGAGSMWGTTRNGSLGGGSIFKINATTGVLTTVVEFPGWGYFHDNSLDIGDLVNDGAGNFWGIAKLGGTSSPDYPESPGRGTLFKVNIASGAFSTVADFGMLPGRTPWTIPNPGLVSDGAGNVWGTFEDRGARPSSDERYQGGAIFKGSASDGLFTEVVQFPRPPTPKDGAFPGAVLVSDPGGSLWGATTNTTDGVGLVYKVDPETWETTIVAEAAGQNKGYFPSQPLMSDGKGSLWAMGDYGTWGIDLKPVLFKVNASTGELATVFELPSMVVLNSFGLPLVNDGMGRFWATADQGELLRIDAVTGTVTALGLTPEGPLSWGLLVSDGKGNLWSTGYNRAGFWSIWEIDPLTSAPRVVISFVGGATPSALCSDAAGKLWGVLAAGSQTQYFGDGTQLLPGHRSIFKLNAMNGKLKPMVELSVDPNNEELHSLVYDGAASFYGTTHYGGAKKLGTIFRFTRGQGITTLFEFTGDEGPAPGAYPAPAESNPTLVRHSEGNLYGSTSEGGILPDGKAAGAGQFYRIRFGPTPVTLMADEVRATTATLNGTLNPNRAVTTASFEYATDAALGTVWTVGAGEIHARSTPKQLRSTISGLDPDTTYYFRIVGVNPENAHPQRGAIMSFTTTSAGTLPAPTLAQPER